MLSLICNMLLGAFIGNQVTRFSFGTIGVTVLDIAVVLVSLGWFIYNNRLLKRIIWCDPVGKAWLYFITVAVLSLTVNIGELTSNEFITASLYLFRWISYSSFFFIVKNLPKVDKEKISKYLLVGGGFIVALGFIQYLFYSDLKNLYYLGWDDHMYRLFSVFLDPNFAAAFLVLFIILLFVKIVRSHVKIPTKNDVIKRVTLLGAIIATCFTFSRSGLIMLVLSLFLLFYFEHKKKLLVMITVGIGVFFLIASQFFYLENVNLFRTASSEERIRSAVNALQIIQANPIFGVGFNAYRYAQIKHGFRLENPPIASHADSGTDNSLLFVLATTGVVGFIFFLHFLYRLFASFSYSTNGKIPLMTMVSVISFVALLVDSIFINSLFYPSIMLWLFVIWGLTDYK